MRDPELAALQAHHPGLREAVVADARMARALRFQPHELSTRGEAIRAILRLIWESDAFAALVLYRAKARLQRARVPILPRLAHHLAIAWGQVSIGDPVLMRPGIYLPHGQVVVDGWVEIGSGSILSPFATVGLTGGEPRGPTIGSNVTVGTGASILGWLTIGDGAVIGANAVVLHDVPAGATVVGVPAREVASGQPAEDA